MPCDAATDRMAAGALEEHRDKEVEKTQAAQDNCHIVQKVVAVAVAEEAAFDFAAETAAAAGDTTALAEEHPGMGIGSCHPVVGFEEPEQQRQPYLQYPKYQRDQHRLLEGLAYRADCSILVVAVAAAGDIRLSTIAANLAVASSPDC
jgi:hypothetical protein